MIIALKRLIHFSVNWRPKYVCWHQAIVLFVTPILIAVYSGSKDRHQKSLSIIDNKICRYNNEQLFFIIKFDYKNMQFPNIVASPTYKV